MLSFDLRSLETSASRIEAALLAEDSVWEEGDVKPVTSVRVAGRLSAAGAEKFYFSGTIAGTAEATCRRCLEGMRIGVDAEVHLIMVEATADEADQPDVYLIDTRQHQLDLRPAIREEWLLAVPQFTVCSETCQGLCSTCGANRNTSSCSCRSAAPPSHSALSSLRDN